MKFFSLSHIKENSRFNWLALAAIGMLGFAFVYISFPKESKDVWCLENLSLSPDAIGKANLEQVRISKLFNELWGEGNEKTFYCYRGK